MQWLNVIFYHFRFNFSNESEAFPELDEEIKLTDLQISDIEGIEVAAEKLESTKPILMEQLQEHLNLMFEGVESYEKPVEETVPDVVRITDTAYIKVSTPL